MLKSLSALCSSVLNSDMSITWCCYYNTATSYTHPPHFSPSAIKADFSLSSPKDINSCVNHIHKLENDLLKSCKTTVLYRPSYSNLKMHSISNDFALLYYMMWLTMCYCTQVVTKHAFSLMCILLECSMPVGNHRTLWHRNNVSGEDRL